MLTQLLPSPADGLHVMTGIPRNIEHHHSACTDQVDTKTAGSNFTKRFKVAQSVTDMILMHKHYVFYIFA